MLKVIKQKMLPITLVALPLISTSMITSCSSQPLQESTGQYVDSSVITTRVKAKLFADKEIASLPITVKTYKNVVQLSGFVNSRYEEARAVALAQTVPGVVHVNDSLVIKHQ